MIYFKLILLFALSALPFFCASCLRQKKNSSYGRRNFFSVIGRQMPRLNAVKIAIVKFLHRMYEGMKKSDNFRKFFTLVILLLMIGVQFVDFSASQEVARMAQDGQASGENGDLFIQIYAPLMSRPHATLLATFLSLSFFFFKAADWILTILHNERKIFHFFAVLTLIILFASPRYIIIVEVMEMILMAAVIYPNKITSPEPKGRKDIPLRQEQFELRKSA